MVIFQSFFTKGNYRLVLTSGDFPQLSNLKIVDFQKLLKIGKSQVKNSKMLNFFNFNLEKLYLTKKLPNDEKITCFWSKILGLFLTQQRQFWAFTG